MSRRGRARSRAIAIAFVATTAALAAGTAAPGAAAPGSVDSGSGLPPITLPPTTLPSLSSLPLLPSPGDLLGGTTEGAEGLLESFPVPAPDPGAAPAPQPGPGPAPAPAPAPEATPTPAPPAPAPAAPEGVTPDGPAGPDGGGGSGGPPAEPSGESDGDSLPARLAAAAGGRANLALLAVGLGVALLGASPRVRTYRRARREVLVRLFDAYEQQRHAAEELADADRLKGEFLSMVSHELRTPLTAVKGFVDTVLLHWDRFPEERRRDLLARAAGNADDLARLIGQLVDVARIDANQVELAPRSLAVRSALETLVGDVAPALVDHPVEVDAPDELVMLADPDAFGHVVVNLLTNAAKFSPPGSPIRVAARAQRGSVVVAVSDRGVGIAPDDQARIFERFYQSRESGAAGGGTGIGLAIARRFTEVQGGRIWVGSELGSGSTFSFTVPAAPRTARREVAAAEAMAS